jgi:carbamoyltransferase
MYVLGISAFFHDSAACLLRNGNIVAAVEEERFSRIKHDSSFPEKAIEFCLMEAKISIDEVSLIVFYEKPFLKFDRILNSIKSTAPFGFNFFRKSIKSWVKTKLWIPSIIKNELSYDGEIIFCEHHEAHAAGSFFTSPFKESIIITIDGVGEKACTTIGIGKENKVTIIKEQHYPHSFGLFYSAFTQYCGFKVNSGEYKLMGLAPYGKPIYKGIILDEIISISKEGAIKLNLDYFSFDKGESTINANFCNLFENPIRNDTEKASLFYCDIAASVQEITDDFLVIISKHAKEITGLTNLCLSGGVALNCKANGHLLKENIFENIWVQPASGDGGGALGAAFIGWNHYLKNNRIYLDSTLQNQVYLGSSYSSTEIEQVLKEYTIKYSILDDDMLCLKTASLLADKNIIGWFQGKMEFGPRALGNRSILASPLFEDMKEHINMKIKLREGFRPFAPIVLEEKASDWFAISNPSKYMLFTYDSDKKIEIPSCIHEDGTARVQTLAKEDNLLLHQLISNFNNITASPVLINTSFNVRGEPIVESPLDALKCFFQTDMDVLVLGNYLIQKTENSIVSEVLTKKIGYELD